MKKSTGKRAPRPATSVSKPDRRDAEATRLRILAVAMEEFGTRGLEGARIDVIARRAKVNKQAIYYHFYSKDKLFEAALIKVYSDTQTFERPATADLHGGNAPECHVTRMRRLVGTVFDHLLAASPGFALIVDENRMKGRHLKGAPATYIHEATSPMMDSVVNTLTAGQEAGAFPKSVDPAQLYVSIISLSMLYLINAHTFSAVVGFDLLSKASIAKRRQHVVDLVLDALRVT